MTAVQPGGDPAPVSGGSLAVEPNGDPAPTREDIVLARDGSAAPVSDGRVAVVSDGRVAVVSDGRVAVVSGGSRGLGRVLVERLLGEGWRVATFSRTTNSFLERTGAEAGDRFFWQAGDLAEPDTLRAFIREVVRRFDRIDLLVNNAAVLEQGLLLTLPVKQIDRLISVNLVAPIVLAQACARAMSTRGRGAIVNVSSINAIRGYRGVAVYSAAKAGVEGFSRSLARELGPLGVRVNCVVPGFFDSEMTAGVGETNRDRILRRTPLGRLVSAPDVAEAVVYLASPGSTAVTGQTIVVDGGITC